jgi:hypothetical protein
MFNLKFALSYFLHQLKAINRHGLHSPFVYRLVDEVIYDFSDKKLYADLEKALQPHKKLNAADKLLYRVIADQQPYEVSVIGKCAPGDRIVLEHAVSKIAPDVNARPDNKGSSNTHNTVFIDASISNLSKNELEQLLIDLQEGIILVVKNNHQSRQAHSLWKQLKGHAHVTVSVDLFWFGLIFHRPGQVKEDFRIKF